MSADGRRILFLPCAGISLEALQTYLLGQALSYALLKRGIEPLHATTVVIQGRAVGFLGDCGHGKSTLAAACLKAGFSLLTDDVLVLRPRRARWLAQPGLPRIKLMPRVARWWMGLQAKGQRMNPWTAKLVIPLAPDQAVSRPVPLAALYALRLSKSGPRSRVRIRPLSRRGAWHELTRGTFNFAVREPGRLSRQFTWAGRLAGQLPVKSLAYPRGLSKLPQVVEALVRDATS